MDVTVRELQSEDSMASSPYDAAILSRQQSGGQFTQVDSVTFTQVDSVTFTQVDSVTSTQVDSVTPTHTCWLA